MFKQVMNNWAGTPNILASCITIVLLFINHITLSDGAAIAAIIAGLTTGWLNVAKYFNMKNGKKKRTP